MDDIIQVVLFILTLVLFIYSAIRKQKKKPTANPTAADDLLESIFGIPPTTTTFETEAEKVEEMPIASQPSKPAAITLPEEGIVAIHNTVVANAEESNIPNHAFDLRSAIIYNEILSRKYF